MQRLVMVGLFACSGEPATSPDAAPPVADASVDAGIDAAPIPRTLFESARVGTGPFEALPARSCDGWQPMVGVRLVTSLPSTITALGAQIRGACESCASRKMFMAIVPLDPATNLPRTADLADAIGSGFAEVAYAPPATLPAAPPSTVFPAAFTLPAGTWGLVVGSNALGMAPVDADLSVDVEAVGDPRYFVYSGDDGQWIHVQPGDGHNRLFITGY